MIVNFILGVLNGNIWFIIFDIISLTILLVVYIWVIMVH